MSVILTADLQARIFAHVESTYPNEGGGFLLGTTNGDTVEIVDTIAVPNTFAAEEQYHRYAMTPQNWMKMEDEADERGLTLVGYHHSHPDAAPVPSEYDRQHALPNFVYVITSVQSSKAVEMRVWWLSKDRTHMTEDTLIIR